VSIRKCPFWEISASICRIMCSTYSSTPAHNSLISLTFLKSVSFRIGNNLFQHPEKKGLSGWELNRHFIWNGHQRRADVTGSAVLSGGSHTPCIAKHPPPCIAGTLDSWIIRVKLRLISNIKKAAADMPRLFLFQVFLASWSSCKTIHLLWSIKNKLNFVFHAKSSSA